MKKIFCKQKSDKKKRRKWPQFSFRSSFHRVGGVPIAEKHFFIDPPKLYRVLH